MAFGVIETNGLLSFPDKNSAEKEPACNTLSATGETINVTAETVLAGISSVAIGVLSGRTAVITAASLSGTACVLEMTLEVKSGVLGQDDAECVGTHLGCALKLSSRMSLP